MSPPNAPRGNLFALLLIVAGSVLFLDNIGLLPIKEIKAYWPAALIVAGVWIVDRGKTVVAIIWAAAFIICGVLMILGNLRILHATADIVWPVMLIAFGATMLARPVSLRWWHERHLRERQKFHFVPPHRARTYAEFRQGGSQAAQPQNFPGNRLHEAIVFSAINRRVETQNFEGGKLDVVFGSIEVDLSGARISAPDRQAFITVNAAFGGIEITVPRTWKVVMKSKAVFGGCDNKTFPPRPEAGVTPETLVVTGDAVFGGITVRN